jgi:Rieske Fe-S protein
MAEQSPNDSDTPQLPEPARRSAMIAGMTMILAAGVTANLWLGPGGGGRRRGTSGATVGDPKPSGRKVVLASGQAQVRTTLPEAIGRPRRISVPIPTADRWQLRMEQFPAFLIRRSDAPGDCYALSAVCPHSGCVVDYQAREQQFNCPCHRASFAVDGSKLTGPSPRGLDPLPLELRDDLALEITVVRYRLNIAERVEAGL